MINSCKKRPSRWLLLTWPTATRSASIMQVSFGREGNLRMMRSSSVHRHAHLHGGGGDHVEGQIGATSMKMVLDSVVGLTPNLKVTQSASCPCRDKRRTRLPMECATGKIPCVCLTFRGDQPRTMQTMQASDARIVGAGYAV